MTVTPDCYISSMPEGQEVNQRGPQDQRPQAGPDGSPDHAAGAGAAVVSHDHHTPGSGDGPPPDPGTDGLPSAEGTGTPSTTGRPAPHDDAPLVLVDGHSLAYRAFYAVPDTLVTTTGQLTNAVYGFTNMLVKLFGEFPPARVAVCFDVGEPAYRTDVYPQYKANRDETPATLHTQVDLIREVLGALRIPVVELDGYEADDLIATIVHDATAAHVPVLVVSGDRDLLQLVDDAAGVRVMLNRRGVTDTVVYDEATVRDRYQVPPNRYVDLAALRGDPSDNLPGVPKVGEKTAAKLLARYDTVEDVVAHAGEERGKLGENLRAYGEDALRNKRLMTLRRDVPLPLPLDELHMGSWDADAVARLAETLEFHTLHDRLVTALQRPVVQEPAAFDVDATTLAPGELPGWLDRVPAGRTGALAPDLRTGPGRAELLGVGLWAAGVGAAWLPLDAEDVHGAVPGDAAHPDDPAVPATGGDDAVPSTSAHDSAARQAHPDGQAAPGTWGADLAALAALLGDSDRPKAVHDAKPLFLAAWAHGWDLAGLELDTALAAYLALPAQRGYELGDLARRYLRKELRPAGRAAESPTNTQEQLSLDMDDGVAAAERRAEDWCLRAQATGELAVVLTRTLERTGMTDLLRRVDLPLVPLLARLEQAGVAVDVAVLEEIGGRLDTRMQGHEARIHELAGEPFLVNSNPQLQRILFDRLGLTRTKKIKTGYTTDASALQGLRTEHPIIEEILGYREVAKLKSTYVDAIPRLVDAATGRLHATFNQMVAATGRLSTERPNVQNIPTRTETGREIRRAFVAGAGYETLLVADYAQIEFRVLAHLVGDDTLVEAFRSGEDVHTTVAGMVWGRPAAEVDRELRNQVKAVTYGLAYGLSAYGLGYNLGISNDEAKALMEAYFGRFGAVRDYLDGVVERARRDGYTATVFGRRRYLPDLTSDNFQRRQIAERMALNAPIQGTAADLIKLAMIAVDQALAAEGLASRVVLQVHDELVLEVAPGETEQVTALVVREMAGVYELRVPLEVATATGRSWADAQH